MSIKLTGATSGSIELDVPAAVSGGDISLTLPNGVGSAGQYLRNSGTAGTLEFANGGKILQVKQTHLNTTSSQALTAETEAEISGLAVTITPTTTDSNMLVFVRWNGEINNVNVHDYMFGLRRGSTNVGNPAAAGSRRIGLTTTAINYFAADADSTPDHGFYFVMDESRPAGTSAITYKATIIPRYTSTLYNQRTGLDTDGSGYERVTSTIVVMEVAA